MIRDLVLHMRPKSWLYFIILFLVGYVVGAPSLATLSKVILGAFIWVVLGNSGCFAYNSYYDKDEGGIDWSEKPPPITKNLLLFSLILMFSGQLLSFLINFNFAIIYFIALIFSIAYSYPRIRFKADPTLNFFTNVFGHGVLTVLAGWLVVEQALNGKILVVLLLMSFVIATPYPLSLFYQKKEDRKRGDRTLVMIWGREKIFNFSIILWIFTAILAIYMLFVGFLKPMTAFAFLPAAYGFYLILKWKDNPKMGDKTFMRIWNAGFFALFLLVLIEIVG